MSYRTMPGAPIELKGLTAIAQAFALPHEMPPMRLPSFPALERTATLSLNATATAAVNVVTRGLLTRQPSFPLWLEHVQGSAIYSFQYLMPRMTAGNAALEDGNPVKQVTGNWTFNSNIAVSGAGTSVGYPYLGADTLTGKGQWFYVPTGWTVGVIVDNCGTPSDDYRAIFDLWLEPGNFRTEAMTIALTVPFGDAATDVRTGMSTGGGWYRLSSVTGHTGDGSNLVIAVGTNLILQKFGPGSDPPGAADGRPWGFQGTGASAALAPYLVSSAYSYSVIPFSNTRITAVAALFTNVTKAINKEGTILAARLNPETVDPFTFSAATFNDIHPAEKYFYGLEKGFYTYAPPSTDLATFQDFVAHDQSGGVGPLYRLDNNAMVNTFLFSDPDGGTALAVNLDFHIEFRNSSQLWPIGLSGMTLEALHQAQLTLVSAGFFFDNPDHKWILEKISQAWKMAKPLLKLHPVGRAAIAGVRTAKQLISGRNLPTQVSQPKPATFQVAVARPRVRAASNSRRRKTRSKTARRGARRVVRKRGSVQYIY